jgi:hypothetical protein
LEVEVAPFHFSPCPTPAGEGEQKEEEMHKLPTLSLKYIFPILAVLLLAVTSGCAGLIPTPATAAPETVSTLVARSLTENPVLPPSPMVVTVVVTQPVTVEALLPTDTPQQTETPLPTITPSPTETPTLAPSTETPTSTPIPVTPNLVPASDPRDGLGSPTWEDTFDSKATIPNWYLFFDEDDPTTFSLSNYELVMRDRQPLNKVTWSLCLGLREVKNFYMEFTMRPESCSGMDSYGFVFRAPDTENGYLAAITCNGMYSLRNAGMDKSSEYLINWASSSSIRKGSRQQNRIGVWANGEHFAMYLNGDLVGEADDDYYDVGRFGPFISGSMTDNFTVKVKDVKYWQLP